MSGALIYLAGEPGVGKTTVMRAWADAIGPDPVPMEPVRDQAPARLGWPAAPGSALPCRAVELGRRRGGFDGTDALPMAVIGTACTYLAGAARSETPLLLVEGARLACRRFLETAVGAGWETHLVLLRGEDAAQAHRDARGSQQAASFIKGRRTSSARLLEAVDPLGVTCHTVEVSAHTTAQELASRAWRAVDTPLRRVLR